ncbi:hypothetical protein WR25_11427 [Diploscapter pachys]|uniref:Uncharacterized protein n=1 Tax=Diploscapter pachys TaxID=2018661 RepID=A0A2A2KS82_9BILA|nr:hypothetical protein WR25_11427 [Diploscapter pachys]
MATETVTTGPSMPVASLAGPSSSTAFAFAALMGCAASPNQQPFNMEVLLKPELGDYSPKTPGGNSTTDEISIW